MKIFYCPQCKVKNYVLKGDTKDTQVMCTSCGKKFTIGSVKVFDEFSGQRVSV